MSLKMEAASLSEVKDRIRDHEGFSIKPYVLQLYLLDHYPVFSNRLCNLVLKAKPMQ